MKKQDEQAKYLIPEMIRVYTEMFGAPDAQTIAAIENRVVNGATRPSTTPDKVLEVLERMGWPI